MQRLRTVTSLDVSAVAGHHAMPAALLLLASINIQKEVLALPPASVGALAVAMVVLKNVKVFTLKFFKGWARH